MRENIARFGDAEDQAVISAANLAGAHELILSLPQGYMTPIGPAGLALSGGQRQRIALARAAFGDPRLIVLDEPNSNLDPNGEAALVEALKRLKERAVTVICVTQRPELILHADYILRLSNGQVDAFGRRDEILGRAMRAVADNGRRDNAASVAAAAPLSA